MHLILQKTDDANHEIDMLIAVTGASGHIGNVLCRMLISRGHQVRAMIHRDARSLEGLQMERYPGDVTHETDLAEFCAGAEVVFHLAAIISIRKSDPLCMKTNVESCLKLIKTARSAGVRRIVHFSSIHAFQGIPLHNELNESRELALNARFSYDRSKALGQKAMLEASTGKTEIIVLNPTAIIGPFDYKPSLLGSALIRFYKGQNPVLIPGGYNWVDVRDVCSTALMAMEYGTGGTSYLLGGHWVSLKTLSSELYKQGGKKPPRMEIPFWLAGVGAPWINMHAAITGKDPLYTTVSLASLRHSHQNISHARAQFALGHNPRPFTETIAETMDWFRENNFLHEGKHI